MKPTDVMTHHPIPRRVADIVERQPHRVNSENPAGGYVKPADIERANRPREPASE
jgi:hypothetical protein